MPSASSGLALNAYFHAYILFSFSHSFSSYLPSSVQFSVESLACARFLPDVFLHSSGLSSSSFLFFSLYVKFMYCSFGFLTRFIYKQVFPVDNAPLSLLCTAPLVSSLVLFSSKYSQLLIPLCLLCFVPVSV